jgi:hypothetical protein
LKKKNHHVQVKSEEYIFSHLALAVPIHFGFNSRAIAAASPYSGWGLG